MPAVFSSEACWRNSCRGHWLDETTTRTVRSVKELKMRRLLFPNWLKIVPQDESENIRHGYLIFLMAGSHTQVQASLNSCSYSFLFSPMDLHLFGNFFLSSLCLVDSSFFRFHLRHLLQETQAAQCPYSSPYSPIIILLTRYNSCCFAFLYF